MHLGIRSRETFTEQLLWTLHGVNGTVVEQRLTLDNWQADSLGHTSGDASLRGGGSGDSRVPVQVTTSVCPLGRRLGKTEMT